VLSDSTTPEEVHLAIRNPNEMVVSWVTVDKTATSTVMYGLNSKGLNMQSNGTYDHYFLPFYESPALHWALLSDLKPNSRYFYQVGDAKGGWSKVFYFDTEDPSPVTPSNPLNVAIFADVGVTSNSHMVFDAMKKENERLNFKYLVLAGDLSYANGLWQYLWDDWGRMIEPLASQFPFMVAPGNHEAISLFIAYNYRFNMPKNGDDNLYYSFNYRNTHVVILNSETVVEFHWKDMYEWTKADFEKVDRSVTPWLFVAFHHPWYCSNAKHQDSAWFMKEEYEDLFHEHKVDVVLQGHVHAYERTYGTYKEKRDDSAPVYMTTGNAGNDEGLYKDWINPQPEWSAYRESVFGFSTMQIFNSTHLRWQMIRGVDSVVRDDAWIVRQR